MAIQDTDDTRSALEAAFDTHTNEPDSSPVVSGGDADPIDTTSGDTEDISAKSKTLRDGLGRFITADETAAPDATAAPVPVVGEAAPAPPLEGFAAVDEKPPITWTPASRETWKDIPAVARQEILKREGEVQRAFQDSASARHIANQLQESVMPFMARIQSQGVTPFQAIGNLMATETMLGTGTKQQRAQAIAQLIKAYDIDIETLDATLVGQPPPQVTQVNDQVQQLVRQQLEPYQQFMNQFQQRQQQAVQQVETRAQTEMETFAADPKHEYFEDVRDMMADLIEVASRRGITMSLDSAYNQATQMDSRIKSVLDARAQVSSAQQMNSAAQKARRVAVSISGSPALGDPGVEQPTDLRGAIDAAIAASQRV